LRCAPLRRASSGASALKRRSGLPKRSTRQSKSERGVVNVDATRQRHQALFEERAHTAALNRVEAARRSSRRSACVTRASGATRPTAETA
jgi:hypothetical protein